MSISSPINPLVAQFAQFNALFEHAQSPTTDPNDFESDFLKLSALRSTILSQQPLSDTFIKTSSVSDKITTVQELSADLTDRVHTLALKVLEPRSIGTSFQSECRAMLGRCVGYTNRSNNCWISAMLQMCQHLNHLKVALKEFGEFYKNGDSFDKRYMDSILHHFETQVPGGAALDEAVSSYNKIREPIFKLKCWHELNQKTYVTAEILNRFVIPSECFDLIFDELQLIAALRSIPHEGNWWIPLLPEAIDALLKKPQVGFAAKCAELKECGQFLIDALELFPIYVSRGQAIPEHVAQNVRIAFNILFGYKIGLTQVFSSNTFASEDVWEALTKLMTGYEEMLKLTHRFPLPFYALKETRRHYRPIGAPSDPVPGRAYSPPLLQGSFTSNVELTHQLIVRLPEQDGLSLEDLFSNTCDVSDAGEGTYQLENGQIQRYACTREQTFFHGHPKQLSVVLSRFANDGIHTGKILTRVTANRVVATPPEMSSLGTSAAHELQSIIVHSGESLRNGHYVSYRKTSDGRWIEFDDEDLRYVSETHIDNILHGTGDIPETYTPYLLFYTLAPQEQQESLLQVAAAMRSESTHSKDAILKRYYHHKQLLPLLDNLQILLQNDPVNPIAIAAALKKLESACPGFLKTLHSLIAINDGVLQDAEHGQKTLSADPRKLVTITKKWVNGSGGHLLSHVIDREKREHLIEQKSVLLRQLNQFLSVLHTSSKDVEDNVTGQFNTLPASLRAQRSEIMKQFNEFLAKNHSSCTDLESMISSQFNALPPTLGKQIIELLIKSDEDRIAFEMALKAGSLQRFILNTVRAHPERNPKQIAVNLQADITRTYAQERCENLRNYMELFDDTSVTNPQLIALFDLNFPRDIKEKLFLKICQHINSPISTYEMGELVFKSNPQFLKYLTPLSLLEVAEGADKLF